jgi:hypothetical protein
MIEPGRTRARVSSMILPELLALSGLESGEKRAKNASHSFCYAIHEAPPQMALTLSSLLDVIVLIRQ